jgi:hypothetical protein
MITSTAFSASQASSHHVFGKAAVLILSLTPFRAHAGGEVGEAGAGEPCEMIVISSWSGKMAVIW